MWRGILHGVVVGLSLIDLVVASEAANSVTFCNKADSRIALAFAYMVPITVNGSQQNRWFTKGWYFVEAGACRNYDPDPNQELLFYHVESPVLVLGPPGDGSRDFCTFPNRDFLIEIDEQTLDTGICTQGRNDSFSAMGVSKAQGQAITFEQKKDWNEYLDAIRRQRADSDHQKSKASYFDWRACIGEVRGRCGRDTSLGRSGSVYDKQYPCRTSSDQIARDISCTRSDGSLRRYEETTIKPRADGDGCGYTWINIRCYSD